MIKFLSLVIACLLAQRAVGREPWLTSFTQQLNSGSISFLDNPLLISTFGTYTDVNVSLNGTCNWRLCITRSLYASDDFDSWSGSCVAFLDQPSSSLPLPPDTYRLQLISLSGDCQLSMNFSGQYCDNGWAGPACQLPLGPLPSSQSTSFNLPVSGSAYLITLPNPSTMQATVSVTFSNDTANSGGSLFLGVRDRDVSLPNQPSIASRIIIIEPNTTATLSFWLPSSFMPYFFTLLPLSGVSNSTTISKIEVTTLVCPEDRHYGLDCNVELQSFLLAEGVVTINRDDWWDASELNPPVTTTAPTTTTPTTTSSSSPSSSSSSSSVSSSSSSSPVSSSSSSSSTSSSSSSSSTNQVVVLGGWEGINQPSRVRVGLIPPVNTSTSISYTILLRYGAPPTDDAFDYQVSKTGSEEEEAVFYDSIRPLDTGGVGTLRWYFTVRVSEPPTQDVILWFQTDCPGSCSAQGKCQADHTCACQDGYTGASCAIPPPPDPNEGGSGGDSGLSKQTLGLILGLVLSSAVLIGLLLWRVWCPKCHRRRTPTSYEYLSPAIPPTRSPRDPFEDFDPRMADAGSYKSFTIGTL